MQTPDDLLRLSEPLDLRRSKLRRRSHERPAIEVRPSGYGQDRYIRFWFNGLEDALVATKMCAPQKSLSIDDDVEHELSPIGVGANIFCLALGYILTERPHAVRHFLRGNDVAEPE